MQAHPRPRALRAPWLRGGRALRAGCRRVPARGFAPARPKTRGAAATGRAVGLIRQGRARPHLAASFRRGAGLLRSARGALERSPRPGPRPLRARRHRSGLPRRARPGGGLGRGQARCRAAPAGRSRSGGSARRKPRPGPAGPHRPRPRQSRRQGSPAGPARCRTPVGRCAAGRRPFPSSGQGPGAAAPARRAPQTRQPGIPPRRCVLRRGSGSQPRPPRRR